MIKSESRLGDIFHTSSRFHRSIQLERDANVPNALEGRSSRVQLHCVFDAIGREVFRSLHFIIAPVPVLFR